MRAKGYEIRVGIFVFIGLIILITIIFSIGDIYFYKPGYHLSAVFGFVNGIEEGSPVRLAGVDIGEVEIVDIFRDKTTQSTMAKVSMWIKKKVSIEKDAELYINTLGLFGEKYIEIIPGTQEMGFLKDGDLVKGRDPVSVERFYEQLEKLSKVVTETFEGINDIVGDQEVRGGFKDTIKDSKELVAELRKLSQTTQSVMERIEKGQGTIGKLVSDDKLYKDISEMIEDLKKNPWKLFQRPKK